MIRPIAIYLPQFHPIPENDTWWGKGFTEWTNVVKSKPFFKGHYQPHIPSDLGFYDLRVSETKEAQAQLAKAHNIYGFCYYHYWFNGKRLLERPVDEVLKSKKPDFPFMLCWANENWSRRWDGEEHEVLMKQEYNDYDDIEHIRYLCRSVFKDSRYIKVDGKPFFLVYRPKLFPDIQKTLKTWRAIALEEGIGELYLGYMQSFGFKDEPHKNGFDCAVNFQPDFYQPIKRIWGNLFSKIKHKLRLYDSPYIEHAVFDYNDYAEQRAAEPLEPNVYPCVMPGWDNSPRWKKGARLFHGSSPEAYGKWLYAKYDQLQKRSNNEFLFINAWNEWAEGSHLEPCHKWGTNYLEMTKKIIEA